MKNESENRSARFPCCWNPSGLEQVQVATTKNRKSKRKMYLDESHLHRDPIGGVVVTRGAGPPQIT